MEMFNGSVENGISRRKLKMAWIKGKSWVPLGEYPRYIPTYTTYIWIIQWLYRAIWGNIGGTTARVHSQGYPTFPFEWKTIICTYVCTYIVLPKH